MVQSGKISIKAGKNWQKIAKLVKKSWQDVGKGCIEQQQLTEGSKKGQLVVKFDEKFFSARQQYIILGDV